MPSTERLLEPAARNGGELFQAAIAKVIHQAGPALGAGRAEPLRASLLGEGENHRNVLIETDARKLVFRITLRQPPGSCPPEKEFAGLALLPAGLGPEAPYYHRSCAVLPHPFAVLSYVEGEPATRWSRGHLELHPRQLGQLHARRFPGFGPLDAPTGRFDPREVREVLAEHRSLLDRDPELAALARDVEAFVSGRAGPFLEREEYCLVHGDLYIDNVLFAGGEGRYIVWEWMRAGDKAEDLARFYGRGFGFWPWYAEVSETDLRHFLATYLESVDDPTLESRVETLNVYYHFADLLYFRQKLLGSAAERSRLPGSRYEECAGVLRRWLAEALR